MSAETPPPTLPAQTPSVLAIDRERPMEIWGYCQSCDRWFYCTSTRDDWACPVCTEAPSRIENRATVEATASD